MRLHLKLHPGPVALAVLVPAAVLLAACGSSSSSSSTTATTAASTTTSRAGSTTTTAAPTTTTAAASTANFNSCSVVTQSEAAAALGSSVTPGVLGNATVEGGLACVFYGPSTTTPTNPNVAQPDSVRVVVVKGPDAVTWYNNYKSTPGLTPQAISGYGDQAYYDGYASLNVLKGDSYVRIAVSPAGAAPSLSAEEQLATAILPKL
jgi:hypothetical protein